MTQDTQIVLPFASLSGRNLQADFDGGTLSSDGGVLFFREIEAQIGIIRRLAGVLDNPRDARYTDHSYDSILKFLALDVSLVGGVAVSSGPALDSAFAPSFLGRPSGQLPYPLW